ncbi:MAG: dehydrogenase [Gemmatimonas sp.]|nr:dehydrogenase [Gemmatimonas sp.]
MNWQQQRVLVTGGTRGIGRELVIGLRARGAKVWATGQSATSVQQAQAALPEVVWSVCELHRPASLDAVVEVVRREGITMLIHNAGVQQLRDFTSATAAESLTEHDEVQINLVAPIVLSRAVLPALRERPGAALVFITSGLALAPKQSSPVYCATKAGLRSFAKALRGQMKVHGWPVRVVEALPPIVDTDMTRGRGVRKLPAPAAAKQILDGLAAGRDEIYVGASRLLKAILRLSPALGESIMIKR